MEGGGAQKNLYKLIKIFNSDDTNLSLITFKKNNPDKFFFKKSIKRYFANVPLYSDNFFLAILNNFIRIKVLRELIRDIQPDSIVSFLPSTNILTIISTLGLKIRILISERNDPEKQKLNFFWSILRLIFYRFANVIICNSQNAVNYIRKISGKNQVTYVKNFVEQKNTKLKIKKKKILISVGRLEKQKNFENLIKGFSRLNSELDGYSLYILGEGSQRKKLENLVNELNLHKKIFLPGFTNPHPYYNSSELYISVSHYEGVSNATIEAMHYGLPIITTISQSGIDYLLQNNFNSLIIKNTTEAISHSMKTLLINRKLSRKLGINARKVIKKQNDELTVKSWKKLI